MLHTRQTPVVGHSLLTTRRMQGEQYYYKPLSARTPYNWIVVRYCFAA